MKPGIEKRKGSLKKRLHLFIWGWGHIWRSGHNLLGLVLFSYHMSVGVQTQVIRLCGSHLHLLSHLTISWQKYLDFEANWVVE